MKYNRFQKFIASLIIFCLLFSITFRIPFFDFRVSATSNETYNLVSIIVDEDTYKEVGGELRRY
ncbi:MAG: hypothetical protein LBU14_03215 [Candidatus Peribacteria bacterium]|jgi:hypothetical protein|nr:hypothetical protein [Candidatus Peribacteria bacterium]